MVFVQHSEMRDGPEASVGARAMVENAAMPNDLVVFLKARLDEDADLGRRCDRAGFSAEWTAHVAAVDFGRGDLTSFHALIAQHRALHDPARVCCARSRPRRPHHKCTRWGGEQRGITVTRAKPVEAAPAPACVHPGQYQEMG